MSVWIWSGQTALQWGTVLFVVLFVPIMAWQYSRFGRWVWSRMLGAAAGCVYLVSLATYTWLPLPARSERWCLRNGVDDVQSVPFAFVERVVDASRGLSAWERFTSTALLQVAFNVLLFIPWGLIVRKSLGRGIVAVAVSGLAASVFIEATQWSGLWFWYPCAYRHADVDDVLMNTAGAVIGGLLAPALLWWMPRSASLVRRRLDPRPITSWRRWAGMLIDGTAFLALSIAVNISYQVARVALGRQPSVGSDPWGDLLSSVLPWAVVFLLPTLNGGGSIGHNAVWITPQWRNADGSWGDGRGWRRLARSAVVSTPLMMAGLSAFTGAPAKIVLGIGLVLVVAAVLSVPFTREHRGLSCVLTGADLVDTRTLPDISNYR